MLLNSSQAQRVFEGSYEERIRALVCTCEEKGWSLVSSKEDSAHVIEADGRLSKRSYESKDGQIVWGRPYYLETFPSSDAVGLVAKSIKDMAESILKGESVSLEALKQVSVHSKDYMSLNESMEVLSGGEMIAYYEENKAEIRKTCRGNLGEIESSNKLTYYTQMSEKRQKEHLEEIKSVLTSCAKSLDLLECHQSGPVYDLIAGFKEQAIKASAIIKHSGTSPANMAISADTFSKSLLTANILKDYAVRTETTGE